MTNIKNGSTPGKVTPTKKSAEDKNTTATQSISTIDFTDDDLVLTTTSTEARIDTRLLAGQLGNRHRHVMALLDKYLDLFKQHGHVSFKNADGERKQGGGKAERYGLVNEDQSYLLLSLSRNSEIVARLKSRLIKVFSDYRRAADMRQTEYLPAYHAIHDQIKVLANGSPNERFVHMNCNKALNKFAGLESGQRSSAPVPKQAMLIVAQTVAARALQSAHDHQDGYQRVKQSLLALTAVTMLEVSQ